MIMCKLCEIKPVWEFTNKKKLCSACFIRYFEKKFFYTIKKFNMIQRDDIVLFKNNKTLGDVVLNDMLTIFAKKSTLTIKEKADNKVKKIAVSSTTDSEADKIISYLINKKKGNPAPIFREEGKIIIKPLYLFLNKEVLLYAKIKRLKFKQERGKKEEDISNFINNLEKKHPEVKHSVINSYLKIG